MDQGQIQSLATPALLALLVMIVAEVSHRLGQNDEETVSEQEEWQPVPEPSSKANTIHSTPCMGSYSGVAYTWVPGSMPFQHGHAPPHADPPPLPQQQQPQGCLQRCHFCGNRCDRPVYRRNHRHDRCNRHRDL